jgi:hypothetical protein
VKFLAFLSILLAAFLGFALGRRNPAPLNPPNLSKCALLYQFDSNGRTYQYCLNPVDQKTGIAIPYSEEDVQRIMCVQGGLYSSAICDKVMHSATAH